MKKIMAMPEQRNLYRAVWAGFAGGVAGVFLAVFTLSQATICPDESLPRQIFFAAILTVLTLAATPAVFLFVGVLKVLVTFLRKPSDPSWTILAFLVLAFLMNFLLLFLLWLPFSELF